MKKWLSIVFLISFSLACVALVNDWKALDLKVFKINIPKNWVYIKQQGEDSFIGIIKASKLTGLSFDCSQRGYANDLIPTEQHYLDSKEWDKGYFYKVGVTYTANFNVHNAKMQEMKEKGITDSSLVHVEADPRYETKVVVYKPTSQHKTKYPTADYMAEMTYRDSTINVPITIPAKIKAHYIQIDSNNKYVYKTIWPKTPGKGMTGIYIHSRTSSFNFQMNGRNLSEKDQNLALQAFKTIAFKK